MLFGVFIVACGATHAFDVWTIWHADYRLSGGVKALTAAASVPTAAVLVWLIPKALAIPSAQQLHAANEALRQEIEARKVIEARLEQSRGSAQRAGQRTHPGPEADFGWARRLLRRSPHGLAVFDSKLRYVSAMADPRLREALKEVRDGASRVIQLEVTGKRAGGEERRRWRVTSHQIEAAGEALFGCEDITGGGSLPAIT